MALDRQLDTDNRSVGIRVVASKLSVVPWYSIFRKRWLDNRWERSELKECTRRSKCSGETLAEGIAAKSPGAHTEQVIRALVSKILLVSEIELENAVTLLIEIEKTVVEGAGAAGLAAMLQHPKRFAGKTVGLVLCGGNIDTRMLASVLTRELAREGRLSEIDVDLPDRPGQLARLTAAIAEASANIMEVVHQCVFTDTPAKAAATHLVLETRERATISRLEAMGLAVSVPPRRMLRLPSDRWHYADLTPSLTSRGNTSSLK